MPLTDFVTKRRRGGLAAAIAASIVTLALAGCGDDAAPGRVTGLMRMFTPHHGPDMRDVLDRGPGVTVAGEALDTDLLKRFYKRHGNEPVWPDRAAQSASLQAAVLRAPEQGLDPRLFHADLLRRAASLPPIERDLVISDAVLRYADALARGAVPVERRGDDQVLSPQKTDVVAAVDDALDDADPARAVEALAPDTPAYRALRHALQGKVPAARRRTIVVNLERQRWLPRPLPADRVWVNAADERLVLYRAGLPVFSTRVVVGEDVRRNQSPEFQAAIDASFYNPPWVIPASIAKAEVLPKLSRDPNYLTRNKMVLLSNGEVEQLPGPEAGLGDIMFDMPNRFDVYLHDTPERNIFSRDNRRLSHGCIRVQNPHQFAAQLTDQPLSAIDQGIAAGKTVRNDLTAPVPVFVVYQTAFLDTAGKLQFRPDFYRRDAAIWQALQPHDRRLLSAADAAGPSPG